MRLRIRSRLRSIESTELEPEVLAVEDNSESEAESRLVDLLELVRPVLLGVRSFDSLALFPLLLEGDGLVGNEESLRD
jgi:hypothetical protein